LDFALVEGHESGLLKPTNDACQVLDEQRAKAAHGERLGPVVVREDKAQEPEGFCGANDGQHARDGKHPAVQGKLAQKHDAFFGCLFEHPPEQDAYGDGQVVARTVFLDVGGGQVYRDALQGKPADCGLDGRSNPFPRFPDGRIWQAYKAKGGQAGCQVGLDLDRSGLYPF
jgi:hypothetical protein